MMKRFSLLAAFVALTPIAEAATAERSQEVPQKYPEFSWEHIPRYIHLYKRSAYTAKEIEFIATFPLITFEKAQGTAEGSVQAGTLSAATAIKKINPKAKILYYKNIVIDWGGSEMTKDLEAIKGAYLQSKDGSFPVANSKSNRKFFDISQPEVQDCWMKDATRMLNDPSIDGVFIDANIKVLVRNYFAKGKKVGDEKLQELNKGYDQLLGRIEQDLKPKHLVIGNILRARFANGGLEYLDYFDGSYLEAFEHNVGGVLRADYVAKGISTAQEAARQGKIIAFTAPLGEEAQKDSSGGGLDETGQGIKKENAMSKRLTYLTALFLTIAEKHSYFFPHDGYAVKNTRRGKQGNPTWIKSLPIFEKKLGSPKGPATKEGYIYTREFEHCSVWLDIENESATLTWK